VKLDVNLPRIPPEATEWDRLLYRGLWYQFRLDLERIAALERTLGTAPTAGGWINRNVTVQTATPYTVLDDDYYMIENNAGATVYVLPDAVTNKGRELVIRSISAQNVTSASANVVPLSGGAAGTAILSPVAGKWALLVSDASVWQIMEGN
jgi:hypothetical protein